MEAAANDLHQNHGRRRDNGALDHNAGGGSYSARSIRHNRNAKRKTQEASSTLGNAYERELLKAILAICETARP
jgi:hypothetical protein